MPSQEKEVIERGSQKHRDVLLQLEEAVSRSGIGSQAYDNAKDVVEAVQGELNWCMPVGVVPTDGVGRMLSVQFLDMLRCPVAVVRILLGIS